MKPILFAEDDTNYSTNGIGVLHDAIRCEVYEEHNGIFDVELEYPADGEWSNEIVDKRQILAKPNDVDDPHAFRIYEIEKDLEGGVIFVRGTTVTDDLGGNLITHVEVVDATPQQALTTIKANLIEPTIFDFVSDIQTRSSATWTRINPLSAIAGTDGSIIDYWGGDIKRTNNTVYLYSRRGRDKVTVITPGKNIDGFNMVTSNKGVITKILPFFTYTPEEIPPYHMVQDYDGTWVKTQQYGEDPDVRAPEETIIGNVVASPNAAYFPVQKYTPVDYSQDDYIREQVDMFIQQRKDEAEASPTPIDNSGFPAELKQYVTDLLNQEASGYFSYRNPGSDEPKVQIKADMITLADSEDWKKYKDLETIQVSDTVDVYVKKFNADVEVSIQSIRYDSIGEKVIAITAGSAKNNLMTDNNRPMKDKIKELEKYISGLENGVYNSIGRTADGQSRRFSGYAEPPADISSEGDLWFKEVGAGVVESYIYKGGVWSPLVSKTTMDSMNAAIESAQKTADDAETQATATANDISSVVTENGFTTLADLIASKVSNGSFSTLYFQESEKIGLMYMVDGVAESIIMIDGTTNTPYIKGEHIILDGNTIVDGTFTVTDTMLAADAVIKKLTATGIDAQDVTIVNLDASSIVSGDLELTNGLRITHNGTPVMEVDAVTGQVKITAPNLATKEELENIELTPGPQGVSVSSVVQYYLVSSSISGVTTATAGWTTTVQTMTETNKYLWSYTKTTFSDNTSKNTTPIIIGVYGDKGVKGNDGTTTYTWVKYADDELGGNMTDTPTGKRYVGMAFNKTTATESNSAMDYSWTPLYDNVAVPGRNLIKGTGDGKGWTGVSAITNGNEMSIDTTGATEKYAYSPYFDMYGGVELTVTFEYMNTANITTSEFYLLPDDYATTGLINKRFLPNTTVWTEFSYTFKTPTTWGTLAAPKSVRLRFDNNGSADANTSSLFIRRVRLGVGNIKFPWTLAPEDIDDSLADKASNTDLENLAGIVSTVSADLNKKAGMGEFDALEAAFNARVEQDIKDKDQLTQDLATMEGRVALVETIAGDNKLVTQFIETVITESEEGIYISNKGANTGILISSDRISFMDNDIEVAYISNQTMQINHGIFVESATISDFKFEKIPGTTILAITWVGV